MPWLPRYRRPGTRAAIERDIREELELHVQMRTEDNIAAGMPPGRARAEAERRFGSVDEVLDAGRRVRLSDRRGDPLRLSRRPRRLTDPLLGEQPMNDLWQDIRFGFRVLAKSPAFTFVAVASLALGIGFNTAMFTLVDAVLFKPRYAFEPERLVRAHRVEPDGIDMMMSFPDFTDLRDRSETLSGVVAGRNELTTLNVDGDAEFVFGESVSHDYFDVHGIQPRLGRDFAPDEDVTPGAHHVAMISETFWRSRFAAAESVIGEEIILGGSPYTIVGVVPSAFAGSTPPIRSQFWVPLAMTGELSPTIRGVRERRGAHSLQIFARLAAGATVQQAGAEVDAIGKALASEYGDTNADKDFAVLGFNDVRVHPDADRMMLPAAGVLMVVVGLVLLIACANVANMMLARASMRRSEIAVRLALGAGRARLLRQLLTESVILSAVGGLIAVFVAWLTLRLVLNTQTPVGIPLSLDIAISSRVLLFAAVLSLGTGILFGLAPALQSLRSDLATAIKGDEAEAEGRVRGSRLRGVLVVVQVAVSLVLLVSAALLMRSLSSARAIDSGLNSEAVLAINTGLPFQGYTGAEAREFHRLALESISALPGAERVAFAERLPLDSTTTLGENVWLESVPVEEGQSPPDVDVTTISSGYFDVLGIAMETGRRFDERDLEGAPLAAIVNPAFAERYWPGASPIGKRLSIVGPDGPFAEVVGVNAPHKVRTLGEEPTPHVYLNYDQNIGTGFGAVIVKATGDPGQVLAGMRREVLALDSNLAIFDTKTMQEHIDLGLLPVRLAAMALSAMGMVGALLAAIGVYGVVAFAVARRTREIGIRMAIGADRQRVVRMILRQGMRSVLIGIALGLLISLAATQALTAVLYGTSPLDPIAFGAAALGLALVGALANLLPARRAAGVNPVRALRAE